MVYEGRAFYNLLQMNLKQDSNLAAEPWQVEEYRKLSEEDLFKRLEVYHPSLDEKSFLLHVAECDSPEDLTDVLYLGKEYSKHEQVFLCVFELWRRLAPHKQSVSLFIDQFDHLIEEYEDGKLENEWELQTAIENFQIILDNHADDEAPLHEVYILVSSYSCHSLSAFMYEYISHQIDRESNSYASELLDGFYPYMDNKRWFDLLRIRLVFAVDVVEEGGMMIERLLDSLQENPEIPLTFEVLHFLIYIGEVEQFVTTFHHAMEQLETEQDFCELLMLAGEYLELVNRGREGWIIENLLDEQRRKNLRSPFSHDTAILRALKEIVSSPRV